MEELKTLIEKRIEEKKFYSKTNPMINGNFYHLSVIDRIKTIKVQNLKLNCILVITLLNYPFYLYKNYFFQF